MTTVGYGDSFPYTLPGRIISFFCCVWGVFLISLMVLTLFEIL
jgi:Ion channel